MTETGRDRERRERREESAEERETVRDCTTDETETRGDDPRSVAEMFDNMKNVEGAVSVRYGELLSLFNLFVHVWI